MSTSTWNGLSPVILWAAVLINIPCEFIAFEPAVGPAESELDVGISINIKSLVPLSNFKLAVKPALAVAAEVPP